ncbi:hypothetical protein Dsin_014187 [Dipteronia sinensis]|uniref:Protein kinase domain-containing protein n=1 Tax=Dipteronia sinensis TaxID=43782 RepID=A0AAE0ALR6_9ROSI|nr:hypothetical protein Dsin_014187 [Dipteronia sinensis]
MIKSAATARQHVPILFDELERGDRIGSGAGGTVYKVFHRKTSRYYALKVICGHHEVSVCLQICCEVQILCAVDNPNVVKCHEMYDHKGEIQSRENGVGRILAQTMDNSNSSVVMIAYMSPEWINTDLNHGRYDGYLGDIWSLGVSVLELYPGRFLFTVSRQGDWASLMCAICMTQPPEAPSTTSQEFRILSLLVYRLSRNQIVTASFYIGRRKRRGWRIRAAASQSQ